MKAATIAWICENSNIEAQLDPRAGWVPRDVYVDATLTIAAARQVIASGNGSSLAKHIGEAEKLELPAVMGMADVAELAHVSERAARQAAMTGRLKAQRVGARWVTTLADTYDWITGRRR